MALPAARLFAPGATEAGEDMATAFADLMRRLHLELGGPAGQAAVLARAAFSACSAVGAGHACIDLASLADDPAGGAAPRWREWLLASPVVAAAEAPDPFRPLVLDQAGRLYLYRYWDFERRLARRLRALDRPLGSGDAGRAAALPAESFAGRDPAQCEVARVALERGLTLISGGPGTGKTTTVVRILHMLLEADPGLRLALAAPTGKAAARMQESVRRQLESLALPEMLRARLPAEAQTIHRLLGARPGAAGFRHGPERPLAIDVLVVDEASMLDLALATRLVEAIPRDARLILLGDPDQLASVEAGAVFAQLCAAGTAPDGPLVAASVELRVNHRFGDESGIGRLAGNVKRGEVEPALALLRAGAGPELAWIENPPSDHELAGELMRGFAAYADALAIGAPASEVLAAFDRYRVLCATRDGPWGVERLNSLLAGSFLGRERGELPRWYPGRPVLVIRNDYALRVFNGDVGVTLAGEDGALTVHFPDPAGGTRAVSPSRLADCDTAFAMTVHKVQGSEFERADLLLPWRASELLTREWLYTAVTRVRRGVRLWGPEAALCAAIEHRTARLSGLHDALRQARP